MFESSGIFFRPNPPGSHSKNVLEAQNRLIRRMYIRLLHESSLLSPHLAAQRAIRIRNDLYRSSTLSDFEMATKFTRLFNGPPCHLYSELVDVYQTLAAKRSLARIICSKTSFDPPIYPGDLVEFFYIKRDHGKRGKWSLPRTVLTFNPFSWTITVKSGNERTMDAAIEEVRPALSYD